MAAPDHQLLVETDAPYMTVDTDRPGQPQDLLQVVAVVATLRKARAEDIAAQTWANAERLFG